MLKKVIFAAALSIGFLASFSIGATGSTGGVQTSGFCSGHPLDCDPDGCGPRGC